MTILQQLQLTRSLVKAGLTKTCPNSYAELMKIRGYLAENIYPALDEFLFKKGLGIIALPVYGQRDELLGFKPIIKYYQQGKEERYVFDKSNYFTDLVECYKCAIKEALYEIEGKI